MEKVGNLLGNTRQEENRMVLNYFDLQHVSKTCAETMEAACNMFWGHLYQNSITAVYKKARGTGERMHVLLTYVAYIFFFEKLETVQ